MRTFVNLRRDTPLTVCSSTQAVDADGHRHIPHPGGCQWHHWWDDWGTTHTNRLPGRVLGGSPYVIDYEVAYTVGCDVVTSIISRRDVIERLRNRIPYGADLSEDADSSLAQTIDYLARLGYELKGVTGDSLILNGVIPLDDRVPPAGEDRA